MSILSKIITWATVRRVKAAVPVAHWTVPIPSIERDASMLLADAESMANNAWHRFVSAKQSDLAPAIASITSEATSLKDKFMQEIQTALAALEAQIETHQAALNAANTAIASAQAEAESHQTALAAATNKKALAVKALDDLSALLQA